MKLRIIARNYNFDNKRKFNTSEVIKSKSFSLIKHYILPHNNDCMYQFSRGKFSKRKVINVDKNK